MISPADFSDPDFQTGKMILVDKPYGWTSFDVVGKIRGMITRKLKERIKTGHAGTLDPLATGLLIICTGKYTKRIDEPQELEKEYTGTFVLGATTPSFDLETEIVSQTPFQHVTEKEIDKATEAIRSADYQIPPSYSAVFVKGKRAYKYARKQIDINIPPKPVRIHIFEITRIQLPECDFRIVCSKGTYIRAVARDFGEILGVGAYLTVLRRTRIGNYSVESAFSMQTIETVLSQQISPEESFQRNQIIAENDK